jgi:hypothetical protein
VSIIRIENEKRLSVSSIKRYLESTVVHWVDSAPGFSYIAIVIIDVPMRHRAVPYLALGSSVANGVIEARTDACRCEAEEERGCESSGGEVHCEDMECN